MSDPAIHRSGHPPATGTGAAPVVGLLYNPRSHRNQGRDLERAESADVLVETPAERGDIVRAVERFAAAGVDLLVVNGGDGTVRDVLTCGLPVFGTDWPALAVLPKGKTNALNVDLGAPQGWELADAIAGWSGGRRVARRPLAIRSLERGGDPLLGFILGAGAFTTATRAGQDAHRMGAFDSLAVGVTTGWGVLQMVLGGNRNVWRRGTPMAIAIGPRAAPLAHRYGDDAQRRALLFSSTLRRFPYGMKPFGEAQRGIGLAVVDRAGRRLIATLPLIVSGRLRDWAQRQGLHQLDVERFEFDLGGQFILDGEAFPAGRYAVEQGPELSFVVP